MGQITCPLTVIFLTFPFLKNHKVQTKVLDPLSQTLTKAPDLPVAYKTLGFSWLNRRQCGGLWPKIHVGIEFPPCVHVWCVCLPRAYLHSRDLVKDLGFLVRAPKLPSQCKQPWSQLSEPIPTQLPPGRLSAPGLRREW